MPQYPIPPWPEDMYPFHAKGFRVRPSKPHYRSLSVVCGDEDGVTVRVLSGDESTVAIVRRSLNSEALFYEDNVGKPFLVVANRRGLAWLGMIGRTVPVGYTEWWMYTHPYVPELLCSEAESPQELQAALEAEMAHIDAMRADGWELVCAVGLNAPYTRDGAQPYRFWADARRPDLDLKPEDLPRLRG